MVHSYLIGIAVVAALLGYLFHALLKPEDLQ